MNTVNDDGLPLQAQPLDTPRSIDGLDLEAEIERQRRKLLDLQEARELLRRQGYMIAVNRRDPLLTSEEFAHMLPLEAIRVLLRRKGRASTRELHDDLIAGGIHTRSRNFINSIGVSMSNAKDIVKDSGGAWRLKTDEEKQAQ